MFDAPPARLMDAIVVAVIKLEFPSAVRLLVENTMRIDLNARTAINFDKQALIKLPRSHGNAIVCTHGALWITETNLPHDISLRAGERFISNGAGPVFVGACGASAFRIVPIDSGTSWLTRIAYQIAWAWRGWRAQTFSRVKQATAYPSKR